jgi:hypothetical protein
MYFFAKLIVKKDTVGMDKEILDIVKETSEFDLSGLLSPFVTPGAEVSPMQYSSLLEMVSVESSPSVAVQKMTLDADFSPLTSPALEPIKRASESFDDPVFKKPNIRPVFVSPMITPQLIPVPTQQIIHLNTTNVTQSTQPATPSQMFKKSTHKESEQKRRNITKALIDELRVLVPNVGKNATKISVLERTVEYIKQLQSK